MSTSVATPAVAELGEIAEPAESATALPLWQQISGLTRENERTMNLGARRAAIRKLVRAVERYARAELRIAAAPPSPLLRDGKHTAAITAAARDAETEVEPRVKPLIEEALAADAEVPLGERTFLWDPLPEICVRLGIARCKLTELSRELTGLSAHELIDRIRAEKIRDKMAADLRRMAEVWLRTRRRRDPDDPSGEARLDLDDPDEVAEHFWKYVRWRRRAPYFHRTSWAIEHGFANYPRFFRACLLVYGKTPHELEIEVLEMFVLKLIDAHVAEAKPVTPRWPIVAPKEEDAGADPPTGPPDPK